MCLSALFPFDQRSSVATEERDVYEELLTQQEVQSCLDMVNGKDFPFLCLLFPIKWYT